MVLSIDKEMMHVTLFETGFLTVGGGASNQSARTVLDLSDFPGMAVSGHAAAAAPDVPDVLFEFTNLQAPVGFHEAWLSVMGGN